ncbi:MAG: triose-phosphate isomerase [archaeon]
MVSYLIAANWKMNKTSAETQTFCDKFNVPRQKDGEELDILICPPFPLIATLRSGLQEDVGVGAQDMHWEEKGAYTGEVSAILLKDLGVSHCIIGHSERRAMSGETDELVKKKVVAALKHDIIPIVCVGESLEIRKEGKAFSWVEGQLTRGLPTSADIIIDSTKKIVIAYEPIWAIGTGETATSDQAKEMHAHIRSFITRRYVDAGVGCLIIYGGSVKPSNAAELISQPNIDGFLVGGASLSAQDFSEICQHASAHTKKN